MGGVPQAMALHAPILAHLAPVTVDSSIAAAAPRGHIVAEGRAAALCDVTSRGRVAFRAGVVQVTAVDLQQCC